MEHGGDSGKIEQSYQINSDSITRVKIKLEAAFLKLPGGLLDKSLFEEKGTKLVNKDYSEFQCWASTEYNEPKQT